MSQGLQALIATDDSSSRRMVEKAVVRRGLEPVECSTVDQSRELLVRRPICVVFCERCLRDGNFHDVMEGVQAAANAVPVVVLGQHSEQYLEAMNSGAFDYLRCPCTNAELDRVVDLALENVSLYAK